MRMEDIERKHLLIMGVFLIGAFILFKPFGGFAVIDYQTETIIEAGNVPPEDAALIAPLLTGSSGWATNVDTNTYSRDITYQSTTSSILYNFPVYLKIDRKPGMKHDFSDLRFYPGKCTQVAGFSPLDVELEMIETNTAHLWARMPTVKTGANDICMSYGDPTLEAIWKKGTVWDSSFSGVFHFNDADVGWGDYWRASTGNDFSLLNLGPQAGQGIVGQGIYFPSGMFGGTNSRYPRSIPTGVVPRTVCGWAKPDYIGKSMSIVAFGDGGGTGIQKFGIGSSGAMTAESGTPLESPNFWVGNTWKYGCMTWENNIATLYGNGVKLIEESRTWNPTLNGPYFWVGIGGGGSNDATKFEGYVDEVRVSRGVRTPDWIKEEYETIAMQDAKVAIGSVNGAWCKSDQKIALSSVIYTCSSGGSSITKTICKYGVVNEACSVPDDLVLSVGKKNFNLFESSDVVIPVTITYEGSGDPVPNANVAVAIGTATVTGVTQENGKFDATFRDMDAGVYGVQITVTNPSSGLQRSTYAEITVKHIALYLEIETEDTTIYKNEAIPVQVNVWREDGVGVPELMIHGELYANSVVYSAIAVTDNTGKAIINFMDITEPGTYMVQAKTQHPYTGEQLVATDSVVVSVLPDYEVDFAAQPVYYSGEKIEIGLTMRNENQDIIDYELSDMLVDVNIGGATYEPSLVKKGFGLFDLSIPTPGIGDMSIKVFFPGDRVSEFKGQVIAPVIRGLTNLPLKLDTGRQLIEVYVKDRYNTETEADRVYLDIEKPDGMEEHIELDRATLGIFGANYDFNQVGRYVVTATVEKSGYEDSIEVSHVDVGLPDNIEQVGTGVSIIYVIAGVVLLALGAVAYGRFKK